MTTRIVSLSERRAKLRREIEANLSPSEKRMDDKLEKLLILIDDMQDRIDTLETRQLQLVRLLNELLSRIESE
jgi:prefoldin subunit 5